MKTGDLNKRLALSDRRPIIPATADIGVTTVIHAIRDFADKYLDGIAIVHTDNRPILGTVRVTFDQLAYALKLAVRHFATDEPVEIDIRVMDDEMHVAIFMTEEPDLKVAAELADAFRKAGFATIGYGLALRFSAPIAIKKNLSLRHPDYQIYVMMLEKIFFR
jgi:hypothetical protein